MILVHEIFINSPADKVFNLLKDVKKWSSFFPPCIYSDSEFSIENRQKINIVAKAGDEILSWTSTRFIDNENMKIHFEQKSKADFIEYMKGVWGISKEGDGCVVELQHEFAVKENHPYQEGNLNNKDDALEFLEKSTNENSNKELRSLKDLIEGENFHHQFEESKWLNYSAEKIMPFLKRLDVWQGLLPHCAEMKVLYDDGDSQEFIMKVNVGSTVEEIRSIRKIEGNTISYFQPTPPYPLEKHCGKWMLISKGDKTKVISFHDIKVCKGIMEQGKELGQVKMNIEKAINSNSLQTIETINNKVGELFDGK